MNRPSFSQVTSAQPQLKMPQSLTAEFCDRSSAPDHSMLEGSAHWEWHGNRYKDDIIKAEP